MVLILRISPHSVAYGAHGVKVVEEFVVKKFTFAISSLDEFLVEICERRDRENHRHTDALIATLRTPSKIIMIQATRITVALKPTHTTRGVRVFGRQTVCDTRMANHGEAWRRRKEIRLGRHFSVGEISVQHSIVVS